MTDSSQVPSERIQRTIHFTGRVQGVGFRHTTERIARGFAVTGFVRNLSDGRVELVAQGAPAEIDQFVRKIHHVMHSHIESMDSADSDILTVRSDFRIER